MAIKFTRSDDLDKMFEEFATLPKIEKVEFPEGIWAIGSHAFKRKKDPKRAKG